MADYPLICESVWLLVYLTTNYYDLTIQCSTLYHRSEKLHEKDEHGIIIRFII
jgi:hypothetical protein